MREIKNFLDPSLVCVRVFQGESLGNFSSPFPSCSRGLEAGENQEKFPDLREKHGAEIRV